MSPLTLHPDVKAKVDSINNAMNDEVKEHFFNPRNLIRDEKDLTFTPDAIGMIGSAGCGDAMSMWLKVENNKIKECKWHTMGCGSAISSSSILSVMLTENQGIDVDKAMQLTTEDILSELGQVSSKKVHCSILCIKALRVTINDYYKRTDQYEKIIIEGARVIDQTIKLTDKDIEEAVLRGAKNSGEVEKLLNISLSIEANNEVNQLIEFYTERYK